MKASELVCKCCHISKPATVDHFHKGKDNRHGLRSVCKQCRSIQSRVKIEYLDRVCKECNSIFSSNKKIIKHYCSTKCSIKFRAKLYYTNHPERVIYSTQKYQRSNKGKVKKYADDYRNKNKHISKKWRDYYTANIADNYVIKIITQSLDIPKEAIPKELIEVKRCTIKLKRHVREYEQRIKREGANGDNS